MSRRGRSECGWGAAKVGRNSQGSTGSLPFLFFLSTTPQRLLVGCEGEHKRLLSFPKLYASRPFESPDFREPALAPIPSRSPLSRFLSPRRIIATMP